jgi:DNA-binding LacI/PurR family transcriptional regulator
VKASVFQPTSPPQRAAAVTRRDVADAAGVSQQTVSRVVNNAPSVREATRRHVLDVIERLGYQRNDAASRLARGPRRTATSRRQLST